MGDVRFRSFRMKAYASLCASELDPGQRRQLLELLDRQDEDGLAALAESMARDPNRKRALALLTEARRLADQLNMMDRTLPALPHAEITAIYGRLRALGDELGDLETQGLSG